VNEKNERNLFIIDTLKISDMPEPVGKMYLIRSMLSILSVSGTLPAKQVISFSILLPHIILNLDEAQIMVE
jgi:hypothetical protein